MRAATFVLGAVVLVAACGGPEKGRPSDPGSRIPDPGSPIRDSRSAIPDPVTLKIPYDKNHKPTVGATLEATAQVLPPNEAVDIVWGTVDGGWVVEDYYHFRGKKFADSTKPLSHATTDADGNLKATITIPEDYGGVHEVFVRDGNTTLAEGGVEVGQTFELHPSEGPVGTVIELRVTGLGWRTMESTWVVNWDNREAGYVSATSTRGTAVARFRASGPAGDHAVNVLTGYMGQAYLNHEQAPNAYLPVPEFAFRVMPGRTATPVAYAEPYQKQPVPTSTASNGASIAIAPTQGPVGTRTTLEAKGLPPNARLSLVWGTYEGSRVSGNGFAPKEKELTMLTTTAEGRLSASLAIPDDLGGRHAIYIRRGDDTLATTYFVTETSIVSMTPASGPVGTPITIHLKGVGWTEYDNIYVATYDNSYMGYACGFNTGGDVIIHMTAAGAPGPHIIDFYPGIYQGPQDQAQQLYRLPMLTYADDHPGNHIPALRFMFDVTEGARGKGPGARAVSGLRDATH